MVSPTVPTGPTTIYIGGASTLTQPSGTGVIWKNGVASPVPDPSTVISLAYSGNNLYELGASGVYSVNGIQPAVQPANVLTRATRFCAKGTDVYITCEAQVIGGDALYWKNGQIVNLTQNLSPHVYSGFAHGIASSGSDIYICGGVRLNSSSFDNSAVYWKNGSIHYIPNGYTAQAITVSGDSVFTCGSAGALDAYWVNDKVQTIGTADIANGIAVSGGDVYVCGTNEHAQDAGFYLKNGQRITLPNSIAVSGIAVYGSDVYCVGNDHDGNAVYWKNTELHILGPGAANCILIVP